ncbi:Uromodulin-like [Micractinium conductrix]|uniref:Uromodulin-like n=1 Tax=Micractinium conductrix TaxID=554055 RepID=A0A2P6VCM8_9CHLO|nr:Uromodulin-like [Micractinium conductrix]|eukprot:PSC71811.1 Uromodulin-like [Micractinium conductrix]
MGAAASCIACGHPKAGANHLDPAAKPAAQPAALPLTADASRGAAAPTTAPSIAEELVRVQLQMSFSPNQDVHLILLPTDTRAQGELSHSVDEWMGTPKKEDKEAAEAAREAEAAAQVEQRPASPRGRFGGKVSPRQKSPLGQEHRKSPLGGQEHRKGPLGGQEHIAAAAAH